MKNPNPDLLVRIAQGDAYCIAYEFVQRHVFHDDIVGLKRFHSNPVYKTKPGCYTDDTQMSIAVSEVLLGSENVFEPITWLDAFVRVFHRDPRDAYSRGFQKALEENFTGRSLQHSINGVSNKNGAAMRSVPLGVISDIGRMLSIAEIQASTTHNSWGGVLSSKATALMSHFVLHTDEPLSRMREFMLDHVPDLSAINMSWKGRVAGDELGMYTVQAVRTILVSSNTLSDVIRQTLEFGGDTDSVGAIAMGIASCRLENDLPDFFEKQLESGGTYGVSFLRELGSRLMNAEV